MAEPERVTIEDLRAAVEWLEAYEGEDDNLGSLLRVSAKLRGEIERRETAQAITKIARDTGGTRAQARAVLARTRGGSE